jgi:hypothetical protein
VVQRVQQDLQAQPALPEPLGKPDRQALQETQEQRFVQQKTYSDLDSGVKTFKNYVAAQQENQG